MADDDLVMLITGTRKGIGKYLAQYYLEKGFKVIGCSRDPVDNDASNYRHFCLDVSDEAAVQQMFAEIRESYGRLDVLLNNAGIGSANHVLLTPVATMRNVFSTNVVGTFLFCREAAKIMVRHGCGRIVNVSSVEEKMRLEGSAVYAASKSAVVTFTQVLARELAGFNITCNVIGPAPIETDMMKGLPEQTIDQILKGLAIRRLGRFQDVSNVIDFLVKPESDYVTGQVVFLGGA